MNPEYDAPPGQHSGGREGKRGVTLREKLLQLPCWLQVKARLEAGEGLMGCVRFIHGQGELNEHRPTSLVKVLDKIRLQVRRPETTDLEPGSQRLEGTPKPGELQFELQRLEGLFQMQISRVKVDRAIERKLRKLLPSVSKEIDLALRIAQSIMSAKQEAGILKRAPQRWEGELKLPTGVQLPVDAGGRERVLRVVRRFILLSGGRSRDGDVETMPDDGDPGPGAIDRERGN